MAADQPFPLVHLEGVLGQLESGHRPPGGSTPESGEVPSLGGENIEISGHLNLELVKRVPESFFALMSSGHLQPGDILINKDGAQTGKVAQYRGEFPRAAINEHVFLLRGKPDRLDQGFLFQHMMATRTQVAIKRYVTGSAQPGLNRAFVQGVQIALPALCEQRRIAEILNGVDETIRSTERIVSKLASLASSWFDHVAISAEHGAQERALSECGAWLSGGTPDTAVAQYWDGDIPWITASSLKTKCLFRSDRTLTPEGVRAGSRLVPKGTLLFVVRGMSLKSEFRVGIAGTDVAFGQDCKALRPDSKLLSEYLYLVLTRKAPEVLALVDEASHGTGRLQTSLIGRLRIPILPLSAQREIVRQSLALEARILLEEQALKKLRLLKQGLMDDLLTGQIRVDVYSDGTA
jgi:type I restriction enzyme, S subunit